MPQIPHARTSGALAVGLLAVAAHLPAQTVEPQAPRLPEPLAHGAPLSGPAPMPVPELALLQVPNTGERRRALPSAGEGPSGPPGPAPEPEGVRNPLPEGVRSVFNNASNISALAWGITTVLAGLKGIREALPAPVPLAIWAATNLVMVATSLFSGQSTSWQLPLVYAVCNAAVGLVLWKNRRAAGPSPGIGKTDMICGGLAVIGLAGVVTAEVGLMSSLVSKNTNLLVSHFSAMLATTMGDIAFFAHCVKDSRLKREFLQPLREVWLSLTPWLFAGLSQIMVTPSYDRFNLFTGSMSVTFFNGFLAAVVGQGLKIWGQNREFGGIRKIFFGRR